METTSTHFVCMLNRFYISMQGPNSPYRELDMKTSLRRQLQNLVILEYPVIHVFLPTHRFPFEVIEDPPLPSLKPVVKPEVDVDDSNTTGVWFREEEMNENYNLEFQDHGTKQNLNSLNTKSFPLHLDAGSGGSNILSRGHSQPERNEEMELGLDLELINPSSDLSSEMNPDYFLNLDGDDTWIDEEGEVAGDFRLSLMEDDLEEGEIF